MRLPGEQKIGPKGRADIRCASAFHRTHRKNGRWRDPSKTGHTIFLL